MNVNQLVGLRVLVRTTDLLGGSLTAVVRLADEDSKSLLLELDSPARLGEEECRFAVAQTRLQRDSLETLLSDGKLGSAITLVPQSRFDPESPFHLSWWRGGGAVIADVVL